MSNVSNFTPEELNLIREIIPLTGFAVAVAGNSGIIGTFKEAAATAKGLGEAATKYPQNELIQSLLKDLSQNRPTMPKYNPLEAGIQEKIKADALAKTRQVIALLAQKATSQKSLNSSNGYWQSVRMWPTRQRKGHFSVSAVNA